MHNENTTGTKKIIGLIIILLSLLMIPMILFGGEVDKNSELNHKNQANYVLKVKGDYISLKAKDASLKDILENIGLRMNIDVVANIPREEKITVDLDMMYLGDVLKRFRTDFAYITTSKKEAGKITKIVVVSKGGGKMRSDKFEYNPQPPIQQFEHKPQPSDVASEYNPQPPVVGSENNSKPSIIEKK